MATMKDIAKRAGVSVATVSYVLNNTRPISREVKERVLLAVQELKYVPNAIARNLRYRKTKTLALILTDITNPFFPELAKACDDVAQQFGYTLIIMNTNEQESKTQNALFQVRNGKVDGLVVASCLQTDEVYLRQLVDERYPMVLAHRKIPDIALDFVGADNENGSYQAIEHLIHLGHQRIAVIRGNERASVITDRIRGYERAMAEANLPILTDWTLPGGHDYSASYQSALTILRLPPTIRPTAILTTSDVAALGAMDAAHDMGIRIPMELALIGFDDLFIASSRNIQLTTVQMPRYDIGQRATRLLIDRIQGKVCAGHMEVILPAKLVIRQSCGAHLQNGRSF